MIRTTKWKLITIIEVDEEGITKVRHLDPILLQDKSIKEEEEDEEEGSEE